MTSDPAGPAADTGRAAPAAETRWSTARRLIDTGEVTSQGTVREWNSDEGFGVVDSSDTPGGCWAHFSDLVMDGYRSLTAGDHVTFTYEAVPQDGFDYRAISVWPPGVEPGTPQQPPQPPGPNHGGGWFHRRDQ
jgi:CspA family cold shock protein